MLEFIFLIFKILALRKIDMHLRRVRPSFTNSKKKNYLTEFDNEWKRNKAN